VASEKLGINYWVTQIRHRLLAWERYLAEMEAIDAAIEVGQEGHK
jgi:hypothetical protein